MDSYLGPDTVAGCRQSVCHACGAVLFRDEKYPKVPGVATPVPRRATKPQADVVRRGKKTGVIFLLPPAAALRWMNEMSDRMFYSAPLLASIAECFYCAAKRKKSLGQNSPRDGNYLISCSSPSNSGESKNSTKVMPRPSQIIFMVRILGF